MKIIYDYDYTEDDVKNVVISRDGIHTVKFQNISDFVAFTNGLFEILENIADECGLDVEVDVQTVEEVNNNNLLN